MQKYYSAIKKVFPESKSPDHTLQLCIIKKYIFPKKCLQPYEIKILNSKKYNEKLNLTRSDIKDKLIEITKKSE